MPPPAPRIAITGAHGFLGWHLACRMIGTRGVEPVRLGRQELEDAERLRKALAGVDTVIHVAGVNRGASDKEVEQGNVALAERLSDALGDQPVHVVYTNSVQCDRDNGYGRGKRRAAEILGSTARHAGRRRAAQPLRGARPAGLQLVRGDVRPRGRRRAVSRLVTADDEVRCCTPRMPPRR